MTDEQCARIVEAIKWSGTGVVVAIMIWGFAIVVSIGHLAPHP